MRHAKSSQAEVDCSDRTRALSKRGKSDAFKMGVFLSSRYLPITPFVSPATRSRLTYEGLCSGWPAFSSVDPYFDEALYTFSMQQLLRWLKTQDSGQELFIIGHNPGLTDLINFLVGGKIIDNLPTASFMHLRIEMEHWFEISFGTAKLENAFYPRDLC